MRNYAIAHYNSMIRDKVRTTAYVEAMRAAIRPGAVVAEIGTGTGMFALVACKLGASRVYAIEPNQAIVIARTLAAQNQCAERIEFIKAMSTSVDLPQKVDVIVSDLRGGTPFYENHIPSVIDARERFLAPGGRLIPAADEIWATLVSSPRVHRQHSAAQLSESVTLDLDAIEQLLVNSHSTQRVESAECIGADRHLVTLDYMSIDHPDSKMMADWRLTTGGSVHGFCLWFKATLAEGISYSNSPRAPRMVYPQTFFPFVTQLDVSPGDRIVVDLEAILTPDVGYSWRWDTRLETNNPDSGIGAVFHQSTNDRPAISNDPTQRHDVLVPPADKQHQHWQFVLESIDGHASIGTIAEGLRQRFPERFLERKDALGFVGDVLESTR